jgi:hypothetical protein
MRERTDGGGREGREVVDLVLGGLALRERRLAVVHVLARSKNTKGELSTEEYEKFLENEIKSAVDFQEAIETMMGGRT